MEYDDHNEDKDDNNDNDDNDDKLPRILDQPILNYNDNNNNNNNNLNIRKRKIINLESIEFSPNIISTNPLNRNVFHNENQVSNNNNDNNNIQLYEQNSKIVSLPYTEEELKLLNEPPINNANNIEIYGAQSNIQPVNISDRIYAQTLLNIYTELSKDIEQYFIYSRKIVTLNGFPAVNIENDYTFEFPPNIENPSGLSKLEFSITFIDNLIFEKCVIITIIPSRQNAQQIIFNIVKIHNILDFHILNKDISVANFLNEFDFSLTILVFNPNFSFTYHFRTNPNLN